MGRFDGMGMQDMAKLDGIKDLRTTVKVKFIKALLAEDKGEHEEAAKLLDEAVALSEVKFDGK
jgi:hypothetical protein